MKKRVLFVCYGNACRSIMAEAFAKHHFGAALEIASAGIAALGSIPDSTLQVLRDAHIPCEGLYSKDILEIDASRFDLIVNLTDIPIGRFIPGRFQGRIIDSHIKDPYGRSIDSFRSTRDAIERMVLEKLPGWIDGAFPSPRSA